MIIPEDNFIIFDKFKHYITQRWYYRCKFLPITLFSVMGASLITFFYLLVVHLNVLYNPFFNFNQHYDEKGYVIGFSLLLIFITFCSVLIGLLVNTNKVINYVQNKVVKNYLRKQKTNINKRYFVYLFNRFQKHYRTQLMYDPYHFYNWMVKLHHDTH
ncbi:hypothetical protein OF377_01095 [Ureaplasma sp. ES3154-GEN]|uniref:hypothetical protein n=1 Tax=Ureaplasma sp. ES3154-GEN TaxID=2984844 RepID=UPI0021E98C0F|nr:hypothetical protein [Ureaplasma sp. ES3154-GEN]MCV3743484.1 hypothetical protein [Ureaplasma sp. ES3154-GEN]